MPSPTVQPWIAWALWATTLPGALATASSMVTASSTAAAVRRRRSRVLHAAPDRLHTHTDGDDQELPDLDLDGGQLDLQLDHLEAAADHNHGTEQADGDGPVRVPDGVAADHPSQHRSQRRRTASLS